MARILDISVRLRPGMPSWPGSVPIGVERYKRIERGDGVNVSALSCDAHTGTHIDAPLHFFSAGRAVSDLDLELLIGPAAVRYVAASDGISPSDLAALELPRGLSRLLLKTRNSDWWASGVAQFREDYVALTSAAAQWIVERKLRLIGIDYLSVQRFHDPTPATHAILLSHEVVIVEGLDLSAVPEGDYQLVCLPLRLEGAEGAPARAVLIQSAADSFSSAP